MKNWIALVIVTKRRPKEAQKRIGDASTIRDFTVVFNKFYPQTKKFY